MLFWPLSQEAILVHYVTVTEPQVHYVTVTEPLVRYVTVTEPLVHLWRDMHPHHTYLFCLLARLIGCLH